MKKMKTFFVSAPLKIKKSLMGNKVTDKIDGEAFALAVDTMCNELISKGYNIMDIIPVNSGGKNSTKLRNGSIFGYGYSYTSGMMIVTHID